MKKRDISHWSRNQFFDGMLLFVQAFEEGVFHYSYESYKLPALNSHYLCYDITSTARDINRKVLMDGNFVPLAEEFEHVLKNDIFIQSYLNGSDTLLYYRDKNGDFKDITSEDLKSKINRYSEISEYLIDTCEADGYYIISLYETLINNIFCDTPDYENRNIIYSTVRTLLTELVNRGYSKEYLYSCVEKFFYDPEKTVVCDEDTFSSFFDCFTNTKYKYKVIFGINHKVARFFRNIDKIEIRDVTPSERQLLNLQKDSNQVLIVDRNSVDIYTAFESALRIANTLLSLHRINQHDSNLMITPIAIVKKEIGEGDYDEGTLIRTPINILKKKGNTSDLHALYNDVSLFNTIDTPKSFYRAMLLHSGAIESKDVSNQLLNLWTSIEILIDTKRDNEDKINTICSVLCAVLNRCYMYSNMEQLARDIKACSSIDFSESIKNIEPDNNEINDVERLAIVLSVDTYNTELETIIQSLNDSPLLKYRIEFFSKYVFEDSQSIYKYLKQHERRIRWHIMRIYRNRNMIVHNGSSMPYRDIIIENLHYYVDVLMDTLIEYYNQKILNHSSIYMDILNDQINYYTLLGTPLNKKTKISNIQITADNALTMIFNNYRGNMIKRAINDVLKKEHTKLTEYENEVTEELN